MVFSHPLFLLFTKLNLKTFVANNEVVSGAQHTFLEMEREKKKEPHDIFSNLKCIAIPSVGRVSDKLTEPLVNAPINCSAVCSNH